MPFVKKKKKNVKDLKISEKLKWVSCCCCFGIVGKQRKH